MREEIHEEILCELANCKFREAYAWAKDLKDLNKEILKEFEKAAEELDNCGWGGTLISKTADKLAKLIGYDLDEWTDKVGL